MKKTTLLIFLDMFNKNIAGNILSEYSIIRRFDDKRFVVKHHICGREYNARYNTFVNKGTRCNCQRYSKISSTCLEKYGVNNPSSIPDVKNKKIKTCIANYGVENPSQSKKILRRKEQTFLKHFGETHHFKNSEFFDTVSGGYKRKEYIMPSGKKITVQGHEHYALKILLESFKETDIKMKKSDVPKIMYVFKTKNHRYYPDFYICSKNTLVEVKSPWTMKRERRKNMAKIKFAVRAGYNFELWLINDRKKNDIKIDIQKFKNPGANRG